MTAIWRPRVCPKHGPSLVYVASWATQLQRLLHYATIVAMKEPDGHFHGLVTIGLRRIFVDESPNVFNDRTDSLPSSGRQRQRPAK